MSRGRKAIQLRKLLEENYPKENYDVTLTNEEFITALNQQSAPSTSSEPAKSNVRSSEQDELEYADGIADDILNDEE